MASANIKYLEVKTVIFIRGISKFEVFHGFISNLSKNKQFMEHSYKEITILSLIILIHRCCCQFPK